MEGCGRWQVTGCRLQVTGVKIWMIRYVEALLFHELTGIPGDMRPETGYLSVNNFISSSKPIFNPLAVMLMGVPYMLWFIFMRRRLKALGWRSM